MLFTCVASALAVVATQTPAVAQESASFRFAGMQFEVPLPAGYCVPRGEDVDSAQVLAAADPGNVTHLTLVPCRPGEGPGAAEYILIKTPVQALTVRIGREQFLSGMEAAFRDGPFNSAAFRESINADAARNLERVTRTPVNLGGIVRPLGLDATCAYLGGTVEVRSPGANFQRAVGICMTAISDRPLNINWYGPDRGSDGVADLLVRSRALAERITATPAP
jgi:hypothetical protein